MSIDISKRIGMGDIHSDVCLTNKSTMEGLKKGSDDGGGGFKIVQNSVTSDNNEYRPNNKQSNHFK